MKVTGQWVYERAIGLMDEGDPGTGRMDTAGNKSYRYRVPGILNMLGPECREAAGAEEPWDEVHDLGEALPLEDELVREALPYGLAAHLFLGEDPAAANFFQQRYEELLARRRRKSRAAFEALPLPYGSLRAEHGGRRSLWR